MSNKTTNTTGWDSIDNQLNKEYPKLIPEHFAPEIKYELGGEDPLDGISIYKDIQNGCFHYITYGFSEIYSKETDNPDLSGYGFELTFRLKFNNDSNTPTWPLNLLQNIARLVFDKGIGFISGQSINSGPIRTEPSTNATGILFIEDPTLKKLSTTNGELTFLQIFGITADELNLINSSETELIQFIENQISSNRLLITDIEK